ncbi:hypothetical protein HO133_007588 [Letharia lupina]|uniref:Uncharacterized protein n=1 Tax=Letharia lupina TaxID=560253 RepID=A0A8H6CQQ0_9LECA|nr:uncharacterized protein HO133_007588 [Letharia lupina]KAF6227860.1 hypothetical protein HO133_007588 [Letharia lupina]
MDSRVGLPTIGDRNALVKDQICAIASPGTTSKALAILCVTGECDHQYYDAYESNMKQALFVAYANEQIVYGLWLWLQAVDQNAPGQWLAYQDYGAEGHFAVLQRDYCIACACKMIQEGFSSRDGHSSKVIRIIYGRLARQDME